MFHHISRFKTWQAHSAQLIFCDTSTPKAGFNIYDELKDRLIRFGVSEEQIAFIHSADTEAKRGALFAAVRTGRIRILIGSTFKLGLGVNVQDKLIALHHLDVPWRPADMVQREGRILRQGNENRKIHIFRYITEGSFDAYSWQLLESKQRMITGILSGSMAERSGSDIEDTVLNYAEVKALAVGNPLIKERVDAANELTRYMALQRRVVDARLRMEQELLGLPAKMQSQQEAIAKCEEDMTAYLGWKTSNPLELGNTEVGNLIRIDHFLDSLEEYLQKLRLGLSKLGQRKADLETELAKGETYLDEIERYQEKVKSLDQKLGVNRT